jgi:hypothetical protein
MRHPHRYGQTQALEAVCAVWSGFVAAGTSGASGRASQRTQAPSPLPRGASHVSLSIRFPFGRVFDFRKAKVTGDVAAMGEQKHYDLQFG